MSIEGRAWVFGHNIDTDAILPGRYLSAPLNEAARHAFESIAPDWAEAVQSGDIIVAGRNFGCGSSRENAPHVIKHLGIACILAESYARIFLRNAIAIGLPALMVNDVSSLIMPMDKVHVDLDTGGIQVQGVPKVIHAVPLHPQMKLFIEAGGIEGILKTWGERKHE